ncbi:MAG: TolC family protein [Planctomycetota bacterium]|nr:TolC family protein [Planctomycetota bacterium]
MAQTGRDERNSRRANNLQWRWALSELSRLPVVVFALSTASLCGCSSGARTTARSEPGQHMEVFSTGTGSDTLHAISEPPDSTRNPLVEPIVQTAFQEAASTPRANQPFLNETLPNPEPPAALPADIAAEPGSAVSLADLETLALSSSPTVLRLEQQVQAAWAKAGYSDKLPDPTIGANVFGSPIETAAGSQRANLSIGQMIPWLQRLDAKSQRAGYEALSIQEALRAEQLRVTAEVRVAWYRLFVLGRQIEIVRGTEEPLKSLITVANAQIEGGKASEADVKLGQLELSRLEERLVALRQQVQSTEAELNRAVGRDSNAIVSMPKSLDVSLPNWSHATLRQLAEEHQPAIAAARLNTQATQWGIEIARLERRPNVAVNANWFLMDDNRPASTVVDVGRDAWSLGAQVSVPIWRAKYDAMENEAGWQHAASHTSVDELTVRYDSMLRDLWEQARAADETRGLYIKTILPQARETRDVSIQAFANGTVEFDRVVRDFLNVLTLEEGLIRATGQLAMTLARIEQAVGTAIPLAERPRASESRELNE